MRRPVVVLLAVAYGAAALGIGVALGQPHPHQGHPVAATPTPTVTVTASPTTSCHATTLTAGGRLPDRNCTPGATNPAVTTLTLGTTICQAGWTATIRPPSSYTAPLKRSGIAAYGYTDTDPAHYEEDHLVPLELGGDPRDPRNLWPEPGASPNPKDAVENTLRRLVCAGMMPLASAQQAVECDWTTAVPTSPAARTVLTQERARLGLH